MDVREKLVELLKKFVPTVWYEDCDEIRHPKCDEIHCAECIADRLIANGVTVQEWIPVSERLPDNNNPVLVYCTNTTISGGYITHIGSLNSGKYWFLRAEPGIATFPVREWQVTHWMPLPEPPKGSTLSDS